MCITQEHNWQSIRGLNTVFIPLSQEKFIQLSVCSKETTWGSKSLQKYGVHEPGHPPRDRGAKMQIFAENSSWCYAKFGPDTTNGDNIPLQTWY